MASATGKPFNINILVTDDATKAIEGINKQLANIQKPFKGMQENIKGLGATEGINRLVGGLRDLGLHALNAFRNIAQLIPGLGALVSAGTVAGILKLGEAFGNVGQRLTNLGLMLGQSPSQMLLLENAFKRAGISADITDSSIKSFGQSLSTIARGHGSADQLSFMSQMKLDASELYKQLQSGDIAGALKKVRDAVDANFQDPLDKQRAYDQLGLSGLFTGMADLEKNMAAAKKHMPMNDEDIKKGKDLAVAFADLKQAGENAFNSIEAILSGPLKLALDAVTKWIDDNREWIKQQTVTALEAVVRCFASIVGWLKDGGWDKIKADLKAIGDAISTVVGYLGGWESAGRAVLIFFATSWLAGMIAPIATVAGLLVGLPTAAVAAAGLAVAALAGIAGVTINGVKKSENTRADAEKLGYFPSRYADESATIPSMYSRGAGSKDHTLEEMNAIIKATDTNKENTDATKKQTTETKTLTTTLEDYLKLIRDALIPGAAAAPTGAGAAGMGAGMGAGAGGRGVSGSINETHIAQMTGLGWTRNQAIGLLTNFQAESSMNPASIGDHGHAYGIGQWQEPRQADFARWAGHSIIGSSIAEQLNFANYELRQGKEQRAGRMLSATTTPGDAGATTSMYYERPADTYGAASNRSRSASDWAASHPAGAGAQAMPANGAVAVDLRVHSDGRVTTRSTVSGTGLSLRVAPVMSGIP